MMTLTYTLSLITTVLLSAAAVNGGGEKPKTETVHVGGGGSWNLLHKSIGIVSMHMQLLHNDRVTIFDRTDYGKSNLSLPNGKCRYDPKDLALKYDCTAHSVEYNVKRNTFRPLMIQTDIWCSSGAAIPDGRLIQTGGFNDGDHVVRSFDPINGSDWVEIPDALNIRRWYSTNQILPDGRQFILGGRRTFNYEFYPKNVDKIEYYFRFLVQTTDRFEENNLYPFVHLNVDGNLFIFANNRAVLLDYTNHTVVRWYPTIPSGDPRNYPSTGSSVLLPLKNLQASTIEAEILICGGSPRGSYSWAMRKNGTYVGALNTCGRIKITDPNPKWVMETMPLARLMGDMILLPNGNVQIINGAARGSAGWELARDPVLNPVTYRPEKRIGSRFCIENPSTIPRMYHSTAILVSDGRILVGGSNPHWNYSFTNVLFPTDLSLEAFSPWYLDLKFIDLRPKILSPISQTKIGYSKMMDVQFCVSGALMEHAVKVTMIFPPFNTHSFSMHQRLLVLGDRGNMKITYLNNSTHQVQVMTPGSKNVAPPGYYLIFVVHQDVPSEGSWVQIQ